MYYDMPVLTAGEINGYALLWIPPFGEPVPVYATETFELDGIVAQEGWNVDQVTYSGVAGYIEQQDVWSSYISKEPFASAAPAAPRARRLNITEGTLTITKNGTFNVANMETVIVNVAGSGSGGSLVATTEEELNALDTPENVGKTVSYNDGLYIITED